MKKHPHFGYFNKRAAIKHAHTQVRLLQTFGEEMNVINCSETKAIKRYNFDKVIDSLDSPNKNRCQSIVKDIYINQCKCYQKPINYDSVNNEGTSSCASCRIVNDRCINHDRIPFCDAKLAKTSKALRQQPMRAAS